MLQPREFYKEELSGFFFWWVAWWRGKSLTTSLTGSPPAHLQPHPRPLSEWRGAWILLVGWEKIVSGNRGNCILELKKQPHPRPLSEWRGEWILLVGWERMVSGNRGNCILKLKRRPSAIEKGVSLCREEPLLASKKHPLHLQTIVFTPLSIRRGVGSEAVVGLGERLSFICK